MITTYKSILTAEMRSLIDKHVNTFNQIPGVVIIHETENWTVVYMNERGLNQLRLSLQEVCSLTNAEYYGKFFNEDDARDYIPKIAAFMYANNREDTLSYYQQLKFPDTDNWIWHLSSTKIFMRDGADKPVLSLTISIPIDAMHHMASKADRLLEENNFLRNNYESFSKLSKREKTILREMALGKSSMEIAAKLYIASTTVDTHRRNIRDKLHTKSYFEISQYARAFDLI
ncbi:response regulator transcription factor [Pedobacter rhodius]|uniref:Helix-turn-helix transcriptional regulator n=1 Tax=Pedobacter rhodius TaxID=3004098 RepID=A0ABT4L4P0_9SPHI|nr:helix-turn-helix transcriptional regulator [Pedobacter sp. SJ11]MCZ4225043.1 helix-turn-helix transcriptional regulator [Pedobacter sp. SJ11]